MPRDAISDDDWIAYASEMGRILQRLRLARSLSQEDVAYAAGLSRYTYQKFESGQSRPGAGANPQLRTLIALSIVLQVAPSELLPVGTPPLRP